MLVEISPEELRALEQVYYAAPYRDSRDQLAGRFIDRCIDSMRASRVVTLPGPDGEPNVTVPLFDDSPYPDFEALTQEWDG